MTRKRIALIGGNGFLGTVLARRFNPLGWKVRCVARGPTNGINEIETATWDPSDFRTLLPHLEGVDVAINLCGKSVDCRYNRKNKAKILNSRITSTRTIAKAIQAHPWATIAEMND